ncbi:MAG: trypsin-like peptidase domain-containing protein [Candidatus Paceibacterota bacterium]|jgi:S1-C subfamily serine protease|nr:trypsin-like peptidase domain-containing protein [Candidatus Paceibacterota bacterium]MDD4830657.1 trypsin-like peptidase domain-containing protein [Candidatus Paceibacterota bacterium]MDD4875264.1 trypsin-like peptidase domain-containing protein [Candidatus Paceibacterota bacterium]
MSKTLVSKLAKKICPAVITIVVSKDLPKIEGFYYLPYGGENIMMPKIEQEGFKERTKIGGGSGFIVSANGYILTSNHVVSDKEADYTVLLDPESSCPAEVLARDPINDIAILKIDYGKLPYLDMGDSNKVEVGETVIAAGNALGEFHDTISLGIVSGLSRFLTAFGGGMDPQIENLRGLIQTDAAINPGNSGGPLVDMKGKVIGINTAVVAGAQNLGFAIPVNYAKKDLEEVKKFGKIKRPYLGIKYILLNKEIAQKNKLPVDYGALIAREALGVGPVMEDSAADRCGLKEYDIILECENEKVSDKNSLTTLLQKHKIGETVRLKVLRNEKEIELNATLDEGR